MIQLKFSESETREKKKLQLKEWYGSATDCASNEMREPHRIKFPLHVQLLAACSNSDLEEFSRLLKLGTDINSQNSDGLTSAHLACINVDFEFLKYLINNAVDINAQDHEGWTPLHAAASVGCTELARLLIENGADLSILSADTELALDVAHGKEMVQLLENSMKAQNLDPVAIKNSEEQALLDDANYWISTGHYEPVINPHTGATPLHVAACKNYTNVIELLLKISNVDVNAKDLDGWTPLHAAAHWNREAAARLLAKANASFEEYTYANQSLFDVADKDMFVLLRQLRDRQRADRNAQAQRNPQETCKRTHPDTSVNEISSTKASSVVSDLDTKRQVTENDLTSSVATSNIGSSLNHSTTPLVSAPSVNYDIRQSKSENADNSEQSPRNLTQPLEDSSIISPVECLSPDSVNSSTSQHPGTTTLSSAFPFKNNQSSSTLSIDSHQTLNVEVPPSPSPPLSSSSSSSSSSSASSSSSSASSPPLPSSTKAPSTPPSSSTCASSPTSSVSSTTTTSSSKSASLISNDTSTPKNAVVGTDDPLESDKAKTPRPQLTDTFKKPVDQEVLSRPSKPNLGRTNPADCVRNGVDNHVADVKKERASFSLVNQCKVKTLDSDLPFSKIVAIKNNKNADEVSNSTVNSKFLPDSSTEVPHLTKMPDASKLNAATTETSDSSSPTKDDPSKRRISVVMVPVKNVETETQRSVKARHVRSTRRSTQGVSLEDVQQAKKLVHVEEPTDAHIISSTTNPLHETGSTRSDSNAVSRFGGSHSSVRSIQLNPVSVSTDATNVNRRAYLKHPPFTAGDGSTANSNVSIHSKLSGENVDDYGSCNQTSCANNYRISHPADVPPVSVSRHDEHLTRSSCTTSTFGNTSTTSSTTSSRKPFTVHLKTSDQTPSSIVSNDYVGSQTYRDRRNMSDKTFGDRVESIRTTSGFNSVRPYESDRSHYDYGSYHNSNNNSLTFSTSNAYKATDSTDSKAVIPKTEDYKRLYLEEKERRERLERELDEVNREKSQLRKEIIQMSSQQRLSYKDGRVNYKFSSPRLSTSSNSSPTSTGHVLTNANNSTTGHNYTSTENQHNRPIFNEDKSKELVRLREEVAKMKEENCALIRVISKLSNPV